MIRIWHQSISELDHLPSYRQMIVDTAAKVTDPDTVVDVHGMTTGTYPEGIAPIDVLSSPWAHFLANIQIVEGAVAAEREGYDAVVITCFHDPGLQEARSAVDIPVLSLCESALLYALTLGDTLGLVGIGPGNVHLVRGLVRKYGLGSRIAGVLELEQAVNEHEIEEVFGSESALTEGFLRRARQLIELGADVIVPSESLLNTALMNQGIREVDGVPVVDSFAVMIAQAEMMVKLARATGMKVSRATEYRKASPEAIAHARAAAAAALIR